MAALYSARLWEISTVSAGTVHSGPVPDGFIWIVRDIDVVNLNKGPFQAVSAANFAVTGLIVLWYPGDGRPRGTTTYEWRGRQVLNAGDQLSFECSEPLWQGLVSGYVLSAP